MSLAERAEWVSLNPVILSFLYLEAFFALLPPSPPRLNHCRIDFLFLVYPHSMPMEHDRGTSNRKSII
jgi:hypothetical protein